MRVALVAPLAESVPPRLYGGTERVVFNLCKGLTDLGHEVTLFASGDSISPAKLVAVVPEALRLTSRQVVDPTPYNLCTLSTVARQADDFDVIHNHHDFWMLPLTMMTERPVLTTLHGRLDLPDIPAAFLSYPRARYVSISDSQRRGALKHLSWARTIHHGLEVSNFEFHPEPGKYLAFLGRMDSDKRPEWAIEIAKRAGVPLKIAAKIDGPAAHSYYEALVKPHVDGKFIEYVGEIREGEKSKFLGEALATVFPIDWPEPFGLVPLESLACGTPVLARPCGAVPETQQDGLTGFVDLDINRLAERVADLASIDRRKCRDWVEERFSLKRMTEDYVDVYRQLVAPAASTHRVAAGGYGRRAAGDRRHFLYSV